MYKNSSRQRDESEEAMNMQGEASYLSVTRSLSVPLDSKKLLKKALQQAGRNPSQRFINEVWESHSSVIQYREYCAILQNLQKPARDELLKVFRSFDRNGDGFLSRPELTKLLTSQGEIMTMSEVDKILQDADTNNDGQIDYSEFCTIMLTTSQQCQQNNLKLLTASDPKKTYAKSSPRPASSQSSYRSLHVKDSLVSSSNSKKTSNTEFNKDNSMTFKCTPQSPGKSAPITWNKTSRKGCFYLDDNGSVSTHEYSLNLPTSSKVWLSVRPYSFPRSGTVTKSHVDTLLLLYHVSPSQPSKLDLVGVTNLWKNSEYCWKGDLRSGSYVLVPFTTGCRLSRRISDPKDGIELIRKDQFDQIQLSKEFKETLLEMFEMSDLDGNGLLNRDEFNWFQLLTSDEEVDDEAWQIVEENFTMKNGELTREGFLQLHLMQAREENAEPTEEFLDTLMCMGYNKALDLDQACPFVLNISAADCMPELCVTELKLGSQYSETESKLTRSVMQMGEKQKLPDLSEADCYIYRDNGRISFVLLNKTEATLEVQIKCIEMDNCVSSRHSGKYTLRLIPNSAKLVNHFLAEDWSKEWSFTCSFDKNNGIYSRRPSSSNPRSSNGKRSSALSVF